MHINKGLAGAAADAVQRGKQTPTHPGVYDAAALLILVARKKGVYPGIPGLEPDLTEAEEKAGSISVAMEVIRAITPGARSSGAPTTPDCCRSKNATTPTACFVAITASAAICPPEANIVRSKGSVHTF
jgi:hypothetical protein